MDIDELKTRNGQCTLQVVKGDAFELMPEYIKQGYVFDMIFVDPPYHLSNGGTTCRAGKRVAVEKGNWDKSNGAQEDLEYTLGWLKLCQQLLTDNGTIWVCGTHHNIFKVGYAMQYLGFKILNTITWEKPNPPPNLACRYFTHATETIIWAAKNDKSKHVFNYQDMKTENDGKQMKSVWRIGAPTAKEKIAGRHPTQKPLDLLHRIIRASTVEGNYILDPFSGSSTAGVAAKSLNRNFTGFEIDPEYVNLSQRRLKDGNEEHADGIDF